MTPFDEALGAEDLSALEAELPRRRWSGKRVVALCAVALASGSAFYAASRYAAPAPVAVDAAPKYVEVPDLTVNLRTSGGERRYLKVRVTLEAPSASDAAVIESRLPGVIDGFQSFLRELRPEDLAGSAGTFRIKEELLTRVNRAVQPARASDVLVQELIQQ